MHLPLLSKIACLLSFHESSQFIFSVSVNSFSVSPLTVSLDSVF